MKTWIIEDEAASLRRLEKLLLEVNPKFEVSARADSVVSTLNLMEEHGLPDLIFLDIHLADGSAFEIFNHIQVDKPVIFTTAYNQYALEAFKVNAIDYLLKPIKKEELARSLIKFENWSKPDVVDYGKLACLLQGQRPPHRFLLKLGQRYRLVDISEVAYFFTEGKITYLMDWQGHRLPLDQSLERVEATLNPMHFYRINRQFIIHVNSIQELIPYSKARVKLLLKPSPNTNTIVSTDRSPYFKRWLKGECDSTAKRVS